MCVCGLGYLLFFSSAEKEHKRTSICYLIGTLLGKLRFAHFTGRAPYVLIKFSPPPGEVTALLYYSQLMLRVESWGLSEKLRSGIRSTHRSPHSPCPVMGLGSAFQQFYLYALHNQRPKEQRTRMSTCQGHAICKMPHTYTHCWVLPAGGCLDPPQVHKCRKMCSSHLVRVREL